MKSAASDSDWRDPLFEYEVEFRIRRMLFDLDREIGNVEHHVEDGPATIVGRIRAYILPGELGRDAVIDASDAIDGDVYGCAEAAFGGDRTKGSDWSPAIEKSFGEPMRGWRVLYCHSVTIDKEHRGRGLGLALMNRLIETFDGECGFAACFPQSLEGVRTATARRKLAKYWRRLGFEPLGRTGYLFVNLDFTRPTLAEAIGAGARANAV